MILFLIGFRGSGKTTIGRQLAAHLGYPWLDSDRQIQQRTNSTITEIFQQQGEAGFRELEQSVVRDMIRELENSGAAVISLGGGSVLAQATRHLIRQHGKCVWLQASANCLSERIQEHQQQTPRPALSDLQMSQEVTTLMHAREPVYSECADYTINTESLTLQECVERIAHWWHDVDNLE